MVCTRPVFLSSCFEDPRHVRLGFRDRICAATGGESDAAKLGRTVWMAEDFPELDRVSPLSPFEKNEVCLDGVRQAECVVIVVTERHGSPVPIEGVTEIPSSFFESEIFVAALLRKPTFLFLLNGYTPNDKQTALLKFLAPAFPYFRLRPASEDQIVRKVLQLVERYERPAWRRGPLRPPNIGALVDRLFKCRHRSYDPEVEAPSLRFLNGATDLSIPRPDPEDVIKILDKASGQKTHQARLSLIWFALRALMGAPYNDPSCQAYLPLWDRALASWTNNGAWYGLHGHFPMSCLAALGSRAALPPAADLGDADGTQYPHGGLASEYYSIAKLSDIKRPIFDLALSHAQLSIERAPDASGGYAMRGSIFLQTGCTDAALADYERVTRLREPEGGTSYGEALSEWGYALVGAGRGNLGIDYMEKGLEILRKGDLNGFVVRAMRKLAVGYLRTGRVHQAIAQLSAAHKHAEEIGARDQIRALEALAVKGAKLLRL